MTRSINGASSVMARLTPSALERVCKDPASWNDPIVHRALLVSGLSVLVASTQLISKDLLEQEA